jgi:hypothetical protein
MPLDPKIILKKEETDQEGNQSNGYASLIRSLIYLAVATCPDIAYAIQQLAAKCVLQYLSGMCELGIKYTSTKEPDTSKIQFVSWSDADYVNNPRDRLSISGYVLN